MAGGARRCKYCSVAADAVCVSKCVVAAPASVLLCRRPFLERYGPHTGYDLRANRLDHSHPTPRARLLFIAAALRGFDLSSDSFACQPKPGNRFLKEKGK